MTMMMTKKDGKVVETPVATSSSAQGTNAGFFIHGFYLSVIVLLVSLLVSSNTSYYRLESLFNRHVDKFFTSTAILKSESVYSHITPKGHSDPVKSVAVEDFNLEQSSSTSSLSSSSSSIDEQNNENFVVIPPDLLVKKVNIIWKTQSNITKKNLDLIWRTADTRTDWGTYSKFSNTQTSEDLYINMLPRKVAQPIEKLMHRLALFVNEKFLIQSPQDGLASSPHSIPEYEKYVLLKGMPFVIRYTAQDGSDGTGFGGIGHHKDNADVSFIVLLNDPVRDFDGGGTHFPLINQTLTLQQGEILLFSGQLVHGAAPITRGKRFVLSGFLTFSDDYLKLKRLTTMETLGYLH